MKTIEINVGLNNNELSNVIILEVDLKNKVGSITSSLKGSEDEDEDYNCAIDGIESLILAQALNGIDIQDEKYIESLKTAINNISENM